MGCGILLYWTFTLHKTLNLILNRQADIVTSFKTKEETYI